MMMFDIDYGMYLFVMFLFVMVGGVVMGFGVGFGVFDCIVGIVKVYMMCVGFGFFLIELFDE